MKRWKKLYGINGTFVCPYCYKTFPIECATKDHKIPQSRKGKSDPDNIIITCKKCNNEKGSLMPEEYKLWLLLDRVRNGEKNIDLIKNLEYVMYMLQEKHYKGIIK